MKQMTKSRLYLRLTALLIIIMILLFRMTANSSQAHSHVSSSGNMLLTSNREELAVCVEVIDGVALLGPETLVNNLKLLFDEQISSHSRWSELGYDKFQNRVDPGCPSAAYLMQPGAKHPLLPGAERTEIPVPMVEVPSPYRIHLYIVSQKVIENAFGQADLRSAPQEVLCEGTECFEVTSALYLTPEEAMNPEILRDRMERILALNLVDIMGK